MQDDGVQDDSVRADAVPDDVVPHVAGAVAALLEQRGPRLGPVHLVCLDGPAGSGKTTLAGTLAAELGQRAAVSVLHLDDLYDGWTGLEGSLEPRVRAQVLEPLRRGRPGRFQRYDWSTGRFRDWVDVPVTEVLVLEGCGAARRGFARDASALVWVEAPAALRLARGVARDGETVRAEWLAWTGRETAHFASERTRERVDLQVDGYGRMSV